MNIPDLSAQQRLLEALGPDGRCGHGVDESVPWARVVADDWFRAAALVRDDAAMGGGRFFDLFVVDRGPGVQGRFEVNAFYRVGPAAAPLRVLVDVSQREPVVDSLSPLWDAAGFYEREAFDLFGVRFRAHPDMRRLLLYPRFIGHPMRRDYDGQKRQPLVRRSLWTENGGEP